jgi:hypothetical protein
MTMFDQYLKRVYDEEGAMPGTTAGAPNAPMSTESIGQPKNYVGTRRPDKEKKKKKKKVNQLKNNTPTPASPGGFIPLQQRPTVL